MIAAADCRVGQSLVAQNRVEDAEPFVERSTGPLQQAESSQEYRRTCLTAAAEFYRARGDTGGGSEARGSASYPELAEHSGRQRESSKSA